MDAEKKLKYRYFYLSFAVAFFLLALFFLALMTALHPRPEQPKQNAEAAEAYLPNRDEALTVLFVGVSADSTEAGTFVLARFDPARGAVPIVTFPPQTLVRNSGKNETLAQVFRYGGADYARRALSDTLGVDIDRYVRMDPAAFLIAAGTVGTVEFDLPVKATVGEGATAMELRPGMQQLDGAKTASLIGYAGYEGGELTRCEIISELTASIVNQRIDIVLSTVLDKVFEKIINLVETDIAYPDFDDRKQAAAYMARANQNPAVAIRVAGQFAGEEFTLSDTFIALMTQTFS